jgi:hypothetical protein
MFPRRRLEFPRNRKVALSPARDAERDAFRISGKRRMRMMKKWICLTLLCAGLSSVGRWSAASEVSEVLRETGFQGGLAVCIGCDDVGLLIGLGAMEPALVQAVDTDPGKIAEVRGDLLTRKVYGKVSLVSFDGRNLPYTDNLVNLIVADGDCEVPQKEILRVLAPRGAALIGEKKLTKPVPPEIDDWTHFLYDASNNAVSCRRAPHGAAMGGRAEILPQSRTARQRQRSGLRGRASLFHRGSWADRIRGLSSEMVPCRARRLQRHHALEA